jgi:hypothetical protein
VLSESSDSESESPGNDQAMKNTVLMKIHDFVQFYEKPEVRIKAVGSFLDGRGGGGAMSEMKRKIFKIWSI